MWLYEFSLSGCDETFGLPQCDFSTSQRCSLSMSQSLSVYRSVYKMVKSLSDSHSYLL